MRKMIANAIQISKSAAEFSICTNTESFGSAACGFALVLSSRASAQEFAYAAEPAKKKFDTKIAELIAKYQSESKAVTAEYSAKIDELLKIATDKGNLENVLVYRAEKEWIEKGKSPTDTAASLKVVQVSRTAYEQKKKAASAGFDKAVKAAHAEYLTDLDLVVKDETKEGRLESAVKVKDLRKQVEKTLPPTSAAIDEGITDAVMADFAKARKAYTATVQEADKKLLAAIARELNEVNKSKATADQKQQEAAALNQAQELFTKKGYIPFAPRLRDDTIAYLKVLAQSDKQVESAYQKAEAQYTEAKNTAAAAALAAEMKKTRNPSVVADWDCEVPANKTKVRWTLYSDGRVTSPTSDKKIWHFDGKNFVLPPPEAKTPGGAWILTPGPSGMELTGRNSNNQIAKGKMKVD